MTKVVAIVQARMGSTRLPGKIMLPAPDGRPLLDVLLERAARSQLVDQLVVAKPRREQWDRYPLFAELYSGSEQNVLARYADCAAEYGATHVVRLTGDCPLVLPEAIDEAVRQLLLGGFDYVRTDHRWPEGLDVEAFTAEALWLALRLAKKPSEREHVTLWMREHVWRKALLAPPAPYYLTDLGHIRVTIDEQADYETVSRVLEALGPGCTLQQIVELHERRVELFTNGSIERNAGLRRSLEHERLQAAVHGAGPPPDAVPGADRGRSGSADGGAGRAGVPTLAGKKRVARGGAGLAAAGDISHHPGAASAGD